MTNSDIIQGTKDNNADLLLRTAQLAAITVLESGGETSRAEEIATIICRTGGGNAEVVSFPTGIFITVEHGISKNTAVVRVKSRSVNLFKVEKANALSRDFSAGKLTLAELNERLACLKHDVLYSKGFVLLAMGLSAAAFTLLFEDKLTLTVLFDMAVAFFASVGARTVATLKRMSMSYQFTITFLSSAIITAFSVICVHFSGIGNLNTIIIGSIMPLLPGLSLTNAIRDTVMGDIVSGTVRIVETLLIAIAIAGGVGVVLASYISLGGVI